MHTKDFVILFIFFKCCNSISVSEPLSSKEENNLPTSDIIFPSNVTGTEYNLETEELDSSKAENKTTLSESFDMRHFNISTFKKEKVVYSFVPLEDPKDPKSNVELIEDGQNTEDEFMASSLNMIRPEKQTATKHGRLAAVLTMSFLFISIAGYLGLLYWRRQLQKRYGNRQILSNEDEYIKDDLKHFSL
ncbi:uncharacterized protein LOC112905046 isoform X2 [Agrilus planipennis]|uniref:Uncharacterized protein LOC112905046 isoform X2 n=1 Tax=Agrilus planipennis TaxID=224129 RepID=A0A7F5R8X6_AGRPL|nr:uncharacterized protein LOC112905046 isoform X2 [Agrilus planipennis]